MRVIAASYSGVLGGAERLLLDVAAGLSEPPELALPEGQLAEEARARGLAAWWIDDRGALGMTPAARVRTAWAAEARLN